MEPKILKYNWTSTYLKSIYIILCYIAILDLSTQIDKGISLCFFQITKHNGILKHIQA